MIIPTAEAAGMLKWTSCTVVRLVELKQNFLGANGVRNSESPAFSESTAFDSMT